MTDRTVKSIPSWQRGVPAESSVTADAGKTDDNVPKHSQPSTSRAALLEQAKKFLEDNEIREATTERKFSFLESKGLTAEEIQELLGVSKNEVMSLTKKRSTTPVHPKVGKTASTLETDMLTGPM